MCTDHRVTNFCNGPVLILCWDHNQVDIFLIHPQPNARLEHVDHGARLHASHCAHLHNPSALFCGQEHIGSLNVAMPHACVMQVLDGMQHLPQQLLHLPCLQLSPAVQLRVLSFSQKKLSISKHCKLPVSGIAALPAPRPPCGLISITGDAALGVALTGKRQKLECA